MSGRKSRSKGSVGERELAALLSERLGCDVVRNLEQTRSGGADLLGVGPFAIEVKRQESLAVTSWWRQAVDQAEAVGKLPALAYRKNRRPWRIRVRLADFIPTFHEDETAEISVKAFCALAAEGNGAKRC